MLETIGNTRLIQLKRIVPEISARVLVKLEYENPTGSMKDRMALAMVEAAEKDGRLEPGGSVVEYTGGSTGVSLAFVCAVKRIPLQIVTSDAYSREKRDHMAARLRARSPRVHVVAVEPAESAVLSGGPSGSHDIEGTGAGFVVPLWDNSIADEILTVTTDEAMACARRLAREEGIFAGTSTGGNVCIALRIAERLGAGKTVVTIACDSGMKYLSTALYAAHAPNR